MLDKKYLTFTLVFVILIIFMACINSRSYLVKPTSYKEEFKIYKEFIKYEYIRDNVNNLEEIGFDYNKDLKKQKNKITNQSFDEIFSDLARNKMLKTNFLISKKPIYKTAKERTYSLASDIANLSKIDFSKSKKEQVDEKIDKLFGVNHRKVYYVLDNILESEDIEKMSIANMKRDKSLEKIIKEKDSFFNRYRYNILVYDSIMDATNAYTDAMSSMSFESIYEDYKKKRGVKTDINYRKNEYINNRYIELALWLSDKERKKGDVSLIRAGKLYYLVEYIEYIKDKRISVDEDSRSVLSDLLTLKNKDYLKAIIEAKTFTNK